MNIKETEHGDAQAVTSIDDMTVQVQNLWERSVFNFDAVFSPAQQEDVFKDCRDLIQSAHDGHNVAIFAYGQTSAGKTHTLFGEPGQPGLAPRTIQEIYKLVRKQSGRFAHTITGSMLELYRNDLVDLLSKDSPRSSVAKKLCVRVDKHGAVQIDNLAEEACQSAAELVELLERGLRHRTTRATAMNAQSSRSHVIFTVRIGQVNLETGEELRGKLMICDLAGSERLKKAMVSGEGAKEAIEINRSLTALGDVVAALRQGKKQIPYRNHKLTQLMQDSLSQASKVLMFVNCSPASSNVEETLMSLKYAARAKKMKTGVAAKGRRASEPAILTPSSSI
jgi:kinesin family protein C2/C3